MAAQQLTYVFFVSLYTIFMQVMSGNVSDTKPEDTMGSLGWRRARRGGGAQRGRAEQDANGSDFPEANRPFSLAENCGQLS